MKPIKIAVALGLLAGACGGSTDVATDTTLETAASTTEAPTTTSEVTTTTTEKVAIDVALYCELNARAKDESDAFFESEAAGDPAAVEAFFDEQNELLNEAIAAADPDIKGSLGLVLEKIESLVSILAANDYDLVASMPELEPLLDSDIPQADQDLLDAYDLEHCGIEPDSDDDGGDDENGQVDGMSSDGSEFSLTIEDAEFLIQGIQAGGAAREEFLIGFQSSLPNMSDEDAACLVDNLTAVQLLSFLAMAEVPSDEIDFSDPGMLALFDLLDLCDLTLADLS